jgi:nucleotide-binding universal stress UspA family protein
MKILLAVDGSKHSRKAARHLATHLGWFREAPDVHVRNVRPPIPYPGAVAAVGRKAIEKYQREEAEAALAVASKELAGAGIAYKTSYGVGEVAEDIGDFVRKNGIDLVVVGSHGHGALANVALGSVATKLLATLEVPVLVVR